MPINFFLHNFRHNEELASMIVRLGTLEHIVACMEDFDTQVKSA